MKLVAFSCEHLRLAQPLPFGLRDGDGRLLLAAGQAIDNEDQLRHLLTQGLYCDEVESAAWRRRLTAEVDQMLRRNESLKSIASAQLGGETHHRGAEHEHPIGEQLSSLARQLDAVLRESKPDDGWTQRLLAVRRRFRDLADRRFDACLYSLIYAAGHNAEHYSCHHALLCALIAEQAASVLEWGDDERESLGRAALSMNIAMVKLQDLLAITGHTPTPDVRREIASHAQRGAQRLSEFGVEDGLWLQIVRDHHTQVDDGAALAGAAAAERLTRLVKRVDIFAAKISRRATRKPMSPVQAAREACVGAGGRPDEIGSALLRAVGLYPPGSFVELVSGEIGIVVARGNRANVPLVVSLIGAAGMPLGEPAMRNTRDPRHGVRAPVPCERVRVHPQHERVLALA